MKDRTNILNELADLQSFLADQPVQNTYSIPDGYFEGLADIILNKIKAIETNDPKKELEYLAPYLSQLSKGVPYSIPSGFFEKLDENIVQNIQLNADYQSSVKEIKTLSPLLSGLQKKNPYSVPENYFENVAIPSTKKEAKVVSLSQKRWYRIAVAAVFIGIVVIGGLLFFNTKKIDPNKHPEEWIAKNVQKRVSAQKIDEFVTMAESNIKTEEDIDNENSEIVKELMKDVPQKDIEDFLNDAIALQSNPDIDDLFNE